MKRRGTFPPEQQHLPAELRGAWVPRPTKSDWKGDGMCLVYTPGFEHYSLSDGDPEDLYEMIEDICTDLERGTWEPMKSWETHHANRSGVRFRSAQQRYGKGVFHVVVGIEWSKDGDGKLLSTVTYRRQFDGPPPADVLAAEEEA